MDACDASRKIAKIIMDGDLRLSLKSKMKETLYDFSDYNDHYNNITSFLKSIEKSNDEGLQI